MTYLDKNEAINDIINNNGLTILQFGLDSCAPCLSIKYKIDNWLNAHPNVTARYIPVEDFQVIAAQNNVFGVPTTILYYQGKEVMRGSRYYSLEELLSKGEKLLEVMADTL